MGQEVVNDIQFVGWPKIHRLNRDVIVTEKLDGTNAAVGVTDDGLVYAQSRKRIITPTDDNYGFAAWVHENSDELETTLGPGLHFGEWWGSGIQRGYGLPKGEKRFSLFNALRWTADLNGDDNYRCIEAPLCHVVPILFHLTSFEGVNQEADFLKQSGSFASPGFMNPEGVVAYHKQSNVSFKVLCENDEEHKGQQ